MTNAWSFTRWKATLTFPFRIKYYNVPSLLHIHARVDLTHTIRELSNKLVNRCLLSVHSHSLIYHLAITIIIIISSRCLSRRLLHELIYLLCKVKSA